MKINFQKMDGWKIDIYQYIQERIKYFKSLKILIPQLWCHFIKQYFKIKKIIEFIITAIMKKTGIKILIKIKYTKYIL